MIADPVDIPRLRSLGDARITVGGRLAAPRSASSTRSVAGCSTTAAPPYDGPVVWVQGDLEGNCLVRDGDLSGIVDWGSACVGDPAVDVQVMWSPLFTEESRRAFVQALDLDDALIARSRGAAINQACAALPYYLDTYPLIVERSWHKLAQLGVGSVV